VAIEEQTVTGWVDAAQNAKEREFREAVHIILSAVANDPYLKETMVIKGGILIAIRYKSRRYTKDVDFSTINALKEIDKDTVSQKLDKSMALMAEHFEYDMECKVQSCKVQPSNRADANFSSIKIKVGYAYKHSDKYKHLIARKCPTTIDIDYSMNERLLNIDELDIGDGETISAYSLTDLIAEKLRSVLQQVDRNRQRRQDIFDLFLLLGKFPDLDEPEQTKILHSLFEKARSRGIDPQPAAFRNPEIVERSRAQYHTLEDEVEEELPDFDESYKAVQAFYESLPWT